MTDAQKWDRLKRFVRVEEKWAEEAKSNRKADPLARATMHGYENAMADVAHEMTYLSRLQRKATT